MKLMLGCHGHRNFGWSLCKGIQNTLLDLDALGKDREEVLAYLDDHCKVFEKVIDDHNKVNSIAHYVIKQELVPKHLVKLIYETLSIHKICGCYIYVKTE